MSPSKRVIFQLTGSIACYKACSVISSLVQSGFDVQTVATLNALNFVGKATLEGLTGKPVLTDTFAEGKMMDHIHLTKWADLLVLCPASADAVNRLSQGRADDLIGALFLANNFQKPYLLFPAMNTQMLKHPATQEAIHRLTQWGAKVYDTEVGSLACGDHGEGRLLDSQVVTEIIFKVLNPNLNANFEVNA